MFKFIPLLLLAALTNLCSRNETAWAYGGADRLWDLQEINGVPFPANTTLSFLDAETIAIQGPCNRITASNTVPYPWVTLTLISSTKMFCPDLQYEKSLTNALIRTTIIEILDDVMILSNTENLNMVFIAAD